MCRNHQKKGISPSYDSYTCSRSHKGSHNIFDNLPALAQAEQLDELERYLLTGPEQVDNVIKWWTERHAEYPCLSRMALDYLSIPGMSPITLN